MAKNQSNVQHVQIGAAANITTSILNSTFVANTGEIGIFAPDGRRMTETLAATEKQFVIAQARGVAGEPKVLVSEVIDKSKIKTIKKKVYAVAAQQVDYIGYNGTSGSIEVNANELYYIQLYLEEYITSSHDGRYIKHGQFNSNSSSTELSIVNGLVASLVNNFSREPKQLIRFERVCNNAGAANTITAGADATYYTFVNGSKIVYGSDSTGLAMNGTDEVNATVVAGDYLRAGTAVTDPVYKIVTVITGTGATPAGTPMALELDIPYQGPTVSLDITTGTEYITAALAAAASWGIKLTGVVQPWSLEKKFDKVVRWTTNLSEDAFGATVVTKSVGASEGTGTYKQVAELERFCQRNDNDPYRIGQPDLFDPRQDASSSGTYDILQIVYTQDENVGFVDNVSPKVYTLAIPASTPNYAVSGTSDDITDVLEVLAFGATTGNPLDL